MIEMSTLWNHLSLRTIRVTSLVLLAAASPVLRSAVKTGPDPGQTIPKFSLNDQNGRAWALDTLAGPNGAMLVFYRSADW